MMFVKILPIRLHVMSTTTNYMTFLLKDKIRCVVLTLMIILIAMTKKILFYKSIIWQMIGMTWISLLSYLWFGDLIRSLSFTVVVMVVSIFVYVLYEMAWEKFMKKKR